MSDELALDRRAESRAELALQKRRRYRTSENPDTLYAKILEQPGVLESVDGRTLNTRALEQRFSFVVEREAHGFRIHCTDISGGSSTTGIVPTLHLRAKFESAGRGTDLVLRFGYARTGWATQRAIGLALTSVGGLLWVFMAAGGAILDRAAFFALFLLFVGPVLVRDLRASRRREREKLAMLNLMEATFGGLALADPGSQPSPYRLRETENFTTSPSELEIKNDTEDKPGP